VIFTAVFVVCCGTKERQTVVDLTPEPTAKQMPVAGPVEYFGELVVQGNRIFGMRTNEPVQVRGLSFFWCNTGWEQESWYTAETVDRMVDEFSVEILRVAMGVRSCWKSPSLPRKFDVYPGRPSNPPRPSHRVPIPEARYPIR